MPDRNWPPGPRLVAKLLRSVAYLFAVVAGAAVHFNPPAIAVDRASGIWINIVSTVAILAGAAAFVGAALHRWAVEWVALWPVGAAFAGYATLGWIRVGQGNYAALAESGALTALSALVFARGVDLLVFSLEVRLARRQRIVAREKINTQRAQG